MTRLAPALALLTVLTCSTASAQYVAAAYSRNPPTFVTAPAPCSTGTASCNVTAWTPGAGHSIVVIYFMHSGQTATGPTDGHNSYSVLMSLFNDTTSGSAMEVWLANSVTAVSTTVTCAQSSAVSQLMCIVFEVTCPSGTCTLDKNPTTVSSSGTSWASGSTTTLSSSNELAIGFALADNHNVTSFTAGSGWTIPTNGSVVNGGAAAEYQIVSSNSSLSASLSIGGAAQNYIFGILTLK